MTIANQTPQHPVITIGVGENTYEYRIEEVVYCPRHPVLGGAYLSLITPEGDRLGFDGQVVEALAQHYCRGNTP